MNLAVSEIFFSVIGKKGGLFKRTEQERIVLVADIGSGYYEYPRRTSATELAGMPGYSKSTLIEYLRKAENKVMEEISGRIT
jgi:predicted DNA binding protein